MKKHHVLKFLIVYDILIFLVLDFLLMFAYQNEEILEINLVIIHSVITFVSIFAARIIGRIYKQIWRYGGIQSYIRLLIVDACAFAVNLLIDLVLPIEHFSLTRLISLAALNLLFAMAIRMVYRYVYKFADDATRYGRFLNAILYAFTGDKHVKKSLDEAQKIRIAIIGAGRIGVSLAEELISNPSSPYIPVCFVDVSKDKANRSINGIPVFLESDTIFDRLRDMHVLEVAFAILNVCESYKKELYKRYLNAGYKIKVYDYPFMQIAGKRQMREFDIEELLFRNPVIMHDGKTNAYYKDKVVLITGGGGSIGSELCRQLAGMQPKNIVILDIYENGAYDIQQELKMAYGNSLEVSIEIASITDRRAMTRVFKSHCPDIVINAAAHKHVPLMEKNCIEAVENNVFGAKVLVDLCEEFGVERFMMVSTDKAVNPTNVMGATKRMCEMIVQSASTYGKVKYSATRFGNVLGSAGSVIPLFKKQIANGGPITLTDKRIVRYFMTIPEAAQLVLQSGAIANNGELFVLDMGQPIRILDLAENMIRLSGATGIEIIETGLRPGEKLYEELLVKTEELDKTENSLIFIERDTPLPKSEIDEKLELLREACLTEDEAAVRDALHRAVPTFRLPEEVNATAETSEEMKNKRNPVTV